VLVAYAEKFLDEAAIGVFPKGKAFAAELSQVLTEGKYLITEIASKTNPDARLILVRRRPGQKPGSTSPASS
jgi:hypothetical protein